MTIENAIIQTTESIKKFQNDFKSFVSSNFLFLVIASAVCIGFATKDMVSDVMNESILPLITHFAVKSIPYFFYNKALEYSNKHSVFHLIIRKVGRGFWLILVWILTLYITFIVFSSISNIDLLTGKMDIVQRLTRYVVGEERNGYPTYQEFI